MNPAAGSGRVIAIGDIHGQIEKLDKLLRILEPDPERDELVFLGDYVDRGPNSREVLDRLLELTWSEQRVTCLRGNHEQMMIDYLMGRGKDSFGPMWLYNGGRATLDSYAQPGQRSFSSSVETAHLEFIRSLPLYYRTGETIFVHAGLRPGIELEEQSARDLLWIRDGFFRARYDWPVRIVFGHTPMPEPFREGKLIGIDTGAAYGGPLTGLILPEEEFVSVD